MYERTTVAIMNDFLLLSTFWSSFLYSSYMLPYASAEGASDSQKAVKKLLISHPNLRLASKYRQNRVKIGQRARNHTIAINYVFQSCFGRFNFAGIALFCFLLFQTFQFCRYCSFFFLTQNGRVLVGIWLKLDKNATNWENTVGVYTWCGYRTGNRRVYKSWTNHILK